MSDGYLLDTNVVSEFARQDHQPQQRVKQWLEAVDPASLYASVLTCDLLAPGFQPLLMSVSGTHSNTISIAVQ